MKIHVDKKEYYVPFDADAIPLGKYMEYHNEFGKALDKELDEIVKSTKSDDDKILALDDHLDKEAISWFSFWTKLPLHEAMGTPAVLPLFEAYRQLRQLFQYSPESAEFPLEVEWGGEMWGIQDFKVNPASEMCFNEIITSKEVMRQVKHLEEGKWTAVPYLCAVFFRKIGEKFVDELIHEGSERLSLMKTLPLSYAIQVSFFLSVCVNIWSSHLVSSEVVEMAA